MDFFSLLMTLINRHWPLYQAYLAGKLLLKLTPSEAPGFASHTFSDRRTQSKHPLRFKQCLFFFVEAHDSFTRGNLSFGVGACWGVRLSVELQSLSPERGADRDGTGLHVFVARKSLLPSHRHEKLLAVARISFFFFLQITSCFSHRRIQYVYKGCSSFAFIFLWRCSAPAASLNCSTKGKKKKKDSDTFFFFPLQYERTESFLLRPSAAVSLNVSKLTGNSLGLFLEGTRRMLFLFKHRRWAGVWEGSDRRAF